MPRRSPGPGRDRERERADGREAPPVDGSPKPAPYTLWQLASQTIIGLLGLSCLAGAFFYRWERPDWSYFHADPLHLAGAGAGLILLSFVGSRFPVLASLAAAIFVMVASGLHFGETGQIDASRILALSAAMLSLWLAMHGRAGERS